MNAFLIDLENRPGMLAGLTGAIAARGINVTGVAGATSPDRGSVALTTDDDTGTRAALDEAGLRYREVALVSKALEHRPGTLHAAAQSLADAGVNIEAVLITGMEGDRPVVAFAVDDAAAAAGALGD
jgi:hypothetical protein